LTRALAGACVALAATLGCGSSGPDSTGAGCEVADDCYSDIERDQIAGEIQCLERVPGGYCTHLCASDADCCEVEGACEAGIPQVCAPFENSTVTRCFLSCEATVVGEQEENAYCEDFAHETFVCRSTGGGGQNRKVCVPDDDQS
jgi:hypothetical protein